MLCLLIALLAVHPGLAASSEQEITVTAPRRTPPLRIALLQEPRPAWFGSEQLRFAYRLEGGRAPLTLKVQLRNRWQTRDIVLGDAASTPGDVALVEASSNRWAGEIVSARLIAIDAAGRRASSRSYPLALPRKTFLNPLAQRLADFRQGLIDGSTDLATTLDQLDGLRLSAEFNDADRSIISKLRLAHLYLSERRSIDAGIDLLWVTALDLESSTRISVADLAIRFDSTLRALRYAPVPMNAPSRDD